MGQERLGGTRSEGVLRSLDPERPAPASGRGQERIQDAWSDAPVGVMALDRDGLFLDVNPAFCELTGYPADRLASTKLSDLCHPEDVEAERGIRRLLSG
ncbi:MAG: PAS domain S-box protein, partial [Actinobacteria bacterium]|nr:PAS domain S-box protein [Actinomycetota bacterium]